MSQRPNCLTAPPQARMVFGLTLGAHRPRERSEFVA
jgi:hypothetical protein